MIPLVILVLFGMLVIFAVSGDKLIIIDWYLSLTGMGYVAFGLIGYLIVYYWGNTGRGLVYASSFIAWGILLVTIALFMPAVDIMGIH